MDTMVWRTLILALFLVVGFSSCSDSPGPMEASDESQNGPRIDYAKKEIGQPVGHQPWIAHLRSADLDGDGLMDLIACEAKLDLVTWVRQTAPGRFEEIVLAENMRAPVHAEAVDLDRDGDLDVLVSCMSIVFPNNDQIGAVIVLENEGQNTFRPRTILDDASRVTDARAADFDGDGDLDIAVGQFGYDQGEVRWMRQVRPWVFESETLIRLSGAINVCVADFDGNGSLDIAAQISQQWEEIHLCYNDGEGNFDTEVVWGSTNEDYASSGMRVCDMNQDGRPDLLFSNGDGFGPSPLPGPRPWHGVQWLENEGAGAFRFHRIGNLPGAYSPVALDMDDDGDQDVVALSSFNDWSNPRADSLVWFENDGDHRYRKRALAYEPTHLLTVETGVFDDSGQPTFVTGGFHAYPPYDRLSRLLLWTRTDNGDE